MSFEEAVCNQLLHKYGWPEEGVKGFIADCRSQSAPAPAGEVVEEIKDMDKCVKCLALEVPGAVHDDVVRIWGNLKRRLAVPGPKEGA